MNAAVVLTIDLDKKMDASKSSFRFRHVPSIGNYSRKKIQNQLAIRSFDRLQFRHDTSPISTPVSPSNASSIFDASFDSIESLPTTFVSSVVPVLETTTVTEVTFGYPRNGQYSITAMTTSSGAVADRNAYTAYGQPTNLKRQRNCASEFFRKQSLTYTDCEWDETLGLHHFLARWMSTLAERLVVRELIGL